MSNKVLMVSPYGDEVEVSENLVEYAKGKGFKLLEELPEELPKEEEEPIRYSDYEYIGDEPIKPKEKPKTEKKEDPSKPKDKMSFAEAALLGASRGATFDFADELVGVFSEKAKESLREKYKQAERERPGAEFAGNILGSLVVPGGIAKTGKAALKKSMAMGALSGIGQAEKMEDVAGSAVLGGTLGGLSHGLFEGARKLGSYLKPENLDTVVARQATKVLNPNYSQLKSTGLDVPEQVGARAFKEGLIEPGSDFEDVAQKAAELYKKSGSKISEIESKVSDAPFLRGKETIEAIKGVSVPYANYSEKFEKLRDIKNEINILKNEFIDFFKPLDEKKIIEIYPELNKYPQMMKEFEKAQDIANKIKVSERELDILETQRRNLVKSFDQIQKGDYSKKFLEENFGKFVSPEKFGRLREQYIAEATKDIASRIKSVDQNIDQIIKQVESHKKEIIKKSNKLERLVDPEKIRLTKEGIAESKAGISELKKALSEQKSERGLLEKAQKEKIKGITDKDIREAIKAQIKDSPEVIKGAQDYKNKLVAEAAGAIKGIDEKISGKKFDIDSLVKLAKQKGKYLPVEGLEEKKKLFEQFKELSTISGKKVGSVGDLTSKISSPELLERLKKPDDIKIGDVLKLKRFVDDSSKNIHSVKNFRTYAPGKGRVELGSIGDAIRKDIRKVLKTESDLDIQKQFPEIYDDWVKANDQFSTAAKVLRITEDQLARDLAKQSFDLTDRMGGYLSLIHGNFGQALAISLLNKYVTTKLNSRLAHLANRVSEAIKKRPDIMQKYVPLYLKHLHEPSKFVITHSMLKLLDPNYGAYFSEENMDEGER